MKKIFTIGIGVSMAIVHITSAQTPIFLQNFNNAAISSYVNDGMAIGDASHVNAVQNSSANFARSIVTGADAGRLQLEKKTYAAGSWISRTTALKSVAPTVLKIQFMMNVSGTQTSATSYTAHGSFVVGDGDGIRSVFTVPDFPAAAATHSMFYFYFPSPVGGNGEAFPGFSLVSDTTNIASQNPTVFSGDQQFTILINNSGLSATYVDPTGEISFLANDRMDVWVGTTQVFDEKLAVSAAVAINGFKFSWSPSIPNGAILQFDNLTIYDESAVTLPVTFTSFEAKKLLQGVVLNWQTASEYNNSHFEILRSETADNFNVIGVVKSKESIDNVKQYSFTDNNPIEGIAYYKIRQVDIDGESSEYQDVKVVSYFGNDENKLIVYKLSEGQYAISVHSNYERNSSISVVDIFGKKVINQEIHLKKGNNNFMVAQNLQKGMYIASIKVDEEVKSLKFLVY